MKIEKSDKIYILGTGEQSPYGIGEIIAIVPAAHNRRIADICSRYYNPPVLRLNSKTGARLSLVELNRKGEKQMDINHIIERNHVEAMRLLEVCKRCPHCGEDCLALDNQCPDQ